MAALLFTTLLIIAAAGDAMKRRIPNLLVLALALSFFPFSIWSGFPPSMLLQHVGTGSVLLLCGYLLFSRGIWGAGDAKLMAATGLWLGFAPTVLFVLLSAIAGGVIAAGLGLWSMFCLEAGSRSDAAKKLLISLKPDVPYGFALATGAILALPYSWLSIVRASN